MVLALRGRYLYRNGTAVRGAITKIRVATENQRKVYFLDYTYETSGGTHSAKWRAKPKLPPEEGPVWVIHHPDIRSAACRCSRGTGTFRA